jgi:hypothetical protein
LSRRCLDSLPATWRPTRATRTGRLFEGLFAFFLAPGDDIVANVARDR